MDSITAIFNNHFCDYGTILVDKKKTWQLLANLFRQNTCLTYLLISRSLTWWIQGLSSKHGNAVGLSDARAAEDVMVQSLWLGLSRGVDRGGQGRQTQSTSVRQTTSPCCTTSHLAVHIFGIFTPNYLIDCYCNTKIILHYKTPHNTTVWHGSRCLANVADHKVLFDAVSRFCFSCPWNHNLTRTLSTNTFITSNTPHSSTGQQPYITASVAMITRRVYGRWAKTAKNRSIFKSL